MFAIKDNLQDKKAIQAAPTMDLEGRQSNLDKLVALIQKEPPMRTDFEIHECIPFLRKHIEWFNTIKPELIHEIIKHCKFLRCQPEDVFIKQGDTGDSMYAILRGDVEVHVIFDSDNEREILAKIESAMTKKKFNKNDFGNEVAQKTGGACIGEVALLSENCMRTATCIAQTVCDFLVLDRALYSVSVKEFIEKEFQDKTDFVEKNPLFRSWTPRQRHQLAIALKKVKVGFGESLARQGQDVDGIFFIFSGSLEIYIDSHQYKKQFPLLYTELKILLPELVNDGKKATIQPPHMLRKERLASHRPQQLCTLGANESIGSLEVILGLESYIETARAPGDCELLMLKRSQFERMFKRKHAVLTLEKLKEALGNKLCLYIYQSDPGKVAFLKYLNMKLMDPAVLQEVKRSKNSKARQGANIGAEKLTKSVEEQAIINILKRLHMNFENATEMPPEDMSEIALAKMDRRLRNWSESSQMNGSKLTCLQSSAIRLSNHSRVA